jgi:poly-gamma-glutamate capsule biosynthesis protein CapA/YwtB (metallophosphatase superfamily)
MTVLFADKGAPGVNRLLAPLSAIILLLLLVSCQPEASVVTLALLGDLMIGRSIDPGPASFSYLTPELQPADLSLANLESPLANAPPPLGTGAGYNLCALAPRANSLAAWGLDMLSLGNNHRLDCNPEGPYETVSILTNLGISPVVTDSKPVNREIHGLKLAFLAFDDVLAPMDVAAATQAIQSARVEGAVVVVSVHWGMEYQGSASDRQKALAQQFAEAGAALIWGHHPHVLQPAVWIPTARGKTLVLFSLGNALFDQAGLPDTRQSALVLVGLDAYGVRSARAVPFEIDVARSLIVQPDAQIVQYILNKINLPFHPQ